MTTGAVLLARVALRASWRGLAVSVAVVIGMLLASTAGVLALYDTAADRASYAATMAESPTVAAINGQAYDLHTLGGIAAYEFSMLGTLLIPVVAIRLAIRLTRADEDSGRTELITARPIGRLAPLAAAALVQVLLSTILGAAAAVGLLALGLPAGGSVAYAAALALFAITYGAIGLLAGQVAQDARTAYALALGTTLLTFLTRALVDGKGWSATWVSPMGWWPEAQPWGGDPVWWPYAAFLALTALLGGLAVAASTQRDLGGGIVATRLGPAHAGRSLDGPAGFAWRMTSPTAIGWLIGAVAMSGTIGLLARDMADLIEGNAEMLAALGIERAEDAVLPMGLLLTGAAALAVVVQGVGRLVAEETHGRLGLLLSTPAGSRRTWLRWWLVVTVEGLVVLAGGSLALGAAIAVTTDDTAAVGRALEDGAWYVIPITLVAALAAVLQAVQPRLVAALWVLPAWAVIVGFLADTLRLPDWSRELSPLEAVEGDPRAVVTLALAVGVSVLLLIGARAFPRRDLVAG